MTVIQSLKSFSPFRSPVCAIDFQSDPSKIFSTIIHSITINMIYNKSFFGRSWKKSFSYKAMYLLMLAIEIYTIISSSIIFRTQNSTSDTIQDQTIVADFIAIINGEPGHLYPEGKLTSVLRSISGSKSSGCIFGG